MRLSTQEIEGVCQAIASMVSVYNQIVAAPSCTSCVKEDCEYRPTKDGEMLRINCPLWEAAKKAEDKHAGEDARCEK